MRGYSWEGMEKSMGIISGIHPSSNGPVTRYFHPICHGQRSPVGGPAIKGAHLAVIGRNRRLTVVHDGDVTGVGETSLRACVC